MIPKSHPHSQFGTDAAIKSRFKPIQGTGTLFEYLLLHLNTNIMKAATTQTSTSKKTNSLTKLVVVVFVIFIAYQTLISVTGIIG
ncbi:hypothetical protein AWN68_17230 [Roseivirga echinicomitans]|uniref:Uncharacterized protein n=1 Tax=Roseivirga echinicomitans TaxID=296218 RepID=A0A150XNF9_9BACT|nr:hypothetical protein AWN68_17230 [Roseivirga echinicomitans]